MAPDTPLRELGPVLERLLEETDPAARERALVRGVVQAGVAEAAALYAEGETWLMLVSRGPLHGLPGAELVEAVAAGELPPDLSPQRTVLLTGRAPDRRALVVVRPGRVGDIGGGEPAGDGGALDQEEWMDVLEALLLVLDCFDAHRSATGARPDARDALGDRVLPPFRLGSQEAERGARPAPPEAAIAHDLRALLRSIRARQDELELLADALDDSERDAIAESMDRDCQRAGDLLLDAFCGAGLDVAYEAAEASASPAPETTRTGRWRGIFEEITDEHAEHAKSSGHRLRVSVIDPGEPVLEATEGDFRIVLETLLHAARTLGSDDEGAIDVALRPRRRGLRGVELSVEFPGPPPAPRSLAALRGSLEPYGAEVRVRASAADRQVLSVWLGAA